MFADLTFAVVVLLIGGVLLAWHVLEWRAIRARDVEPSELPFAQRRYRRRVQTSSLILLLGVAIFCGTVFHLLNPFYWAGVLLVVLGIVLLAGADLIAVRSHYGRKHHAQRVELARLESMLRRARQPRTNGESAKTDPRQAEEP